MIREKETIHINDRHVLPLKAFELNQKTQVGSRIDSFNSTHFHNLTSDMMDHHFCSILFVRSESLGPTTLKGKDYTRV